MKKMNFSLGPWNFHPVVKTGGITMRFKELNINILDFVNFLTVNIFDIEFFGTFKIV